MQISKNGTFLNFTELPQRVPGWVWLIGSVVGIAVTGGLLWWLQVDPGLALGVFWTLLIPVVPLILLLAPGLWRNLCPLAFANQLPRKLGLGLGRTLSRRGQRIAATFSILVFIALVWLRHPLLNHDAGALTLMIGGALALALIGGLLYKGRSGWCGTFCPMAPIEKLYGHAPLVMVRNGHCKPCVGCQRNCYDFNPRAAIYSDLDDRETWRGERRKIFAALLPGLMIAFFNAQPPQEVGWLLYTSSFFLPVLVSIGTFYTLANFTKLSEYQLTTAYGIVALGLFYWHVLPISAGEIESLLGHRIPTYQLDMMRALAALLALLVLARGVHTERLYEEARANAVGANVGKGLAALQSAVHSVARQAEVRDDYSGARLLVAPQQTLLDVLEEARVPIAFECRAGSCGKCALRIRDGAEHLSAPGPVEAETLHRLGLADGWRLACSCRVAGPVRIDTNPQGGDEIERGAEADAPLHSEPAPGQRRVVIIGNGVGGISAAEALRKRDPDCHITIVSRETRAFYNRMALCKVIYGNRALEGLTIMPDDWYRDNGIDVWLNTLVADIDREAHSVQLATGQRLDYDKLVLATGAEAFVPPFYGAKLRGIYVLRNADDALAIRRWIQSRRCRHAVVLGGGVLGVETADALRELGLTVQIIESAPRLMVGQLDGASALLVQQHLEEKGIKVATDEELSAAIGSNRIHGVTLSDHLHHLPADIMVVCAGVRPEVGLARKAELDIERGIVVDSSMRTSDPDILAVGDVAEIDGRLPSLWASATEQGRIAACSIVGKEAHFEVSTTPPVYLKVKGIELCAFGTPHPPDDEAWLATELSIRGRRRCLLVVRERRIIGGVFVNAPELARRAVHIYRHGQMLSAEGADALLGGDWSGLDGVESEAEDDDSGVPAGESGFVA